MATIINHLLIDPDLKKAFEDLATDLADIRAKYANVNTDLVDIRTKFATLLAKLDLDAGVTDADYGATQALAATAGAATLATATFSKA